MKNTALIRLIISMCIFGTVGIVVSGIQLPSGFIALVRGIVGASVMLLFSVIKKRKADLSQIKGQLARLILSGAFIGANWVLLFESYKYTGVAVSTLFYYTSPVLVVLFSVLLLGEKLRLGRALFFIPVLLGMLLVSGVFEKGTGDNSLIGILLALAAAVLYALAVITTKPVKDAPAYDVTVIQLLSASAVIFPYALFTGGVNFGALEPKTVILLAVSGVIHTALAYGLYFSSLNELSSTTIAAFSYLDPCVALFASYFILHQELSILQTVGAFVMLASLVLSEVICGKRK